MKVSKYFDIRELVSKETYEKWGDNSKQFLSPQLVSGLDNLKELLQKDYGDHSLIVNDWMYGGQFFYSGYRNPECTEGARESAHRRGQAADMKIKLKNGDMLSGDTMREYVKKNWNSLKYFFSTIEADTKTWLHVDCRWTDFEKIKTSPIIVPIPK